MIDRGEHNVIELTGVTVRQHNGGNQSFRNAVAEQQLCGVRRRVHHNAATVHPQL
jgi:hypothetical protein